MIKIEPFAGASCHDSQKPEEFEHHKEKKQNNNSQKDYRKAQSMKTVIANTLTSYFLSCFWNGCTVC